MHFYVDGYILSIQFLYIYVLQKDRVYPFYWISSVRQTVCTFGNNC